MILVIGKDDQVLFQSGQTEHPQTMFEIYAALDQIDTFKRHTDKNFLEYSSDLSIKGQNIFAYLTSDQTVVFFVCGDQLAQNHKKIKKIFKLVHYEFAKVILEPLYELNTYITSQRFRNQVEKIIQINTAYQQVIF